jgi:carbonic anhydrase/acetyltransferase-like protein (isoleucine patch superfamily)
VVIGLVEIGPRATVWPTAVLRSDVGRIVVGAFSSIQDGTVIHATVEDDPPRAQASPSA